MEIENFISIENGKNDTDVDNNGRLVENLLTSKERRASDCNTHSCVYLFDFKA